MKRKTVVSAAVLGLQQAKGIQRCEEGKYNSQQIKGKEKIRVGGVLRVTGCLAEITQRLAAEPLY